MLTRARNRLPTLAAMLIAGSLVALPAAAQPRPGDVDPLSADDFPGLLAAYEGRVTLVNLWATWCAPCLREIPELLELEADYADRGFSLVEISLDDVDAVDTIREFRDKWFPTLKTWHSTSDDWYELIAALDPRWSGILPTSFVLDRDGNVVATITGGRDYAGFEAAITPLL